jgi:hypothetical protein
MGRETTMPHIHTRWGRLIGAMLLGVGGIGMGISPAWGQPAELPLSVTVEGGFTSRDIDENGAAGQFSGTADSGRLLVTLAYRPVPQVTLYVVGGGASLQIDEFGYAANLDGIYGGGLTLSADLLPGASLFVDGRYVRLVSEDTVLPLINVSPTQETITWNEYRGRIGIKGRHPVLSPYGGLQVSFVRGHDQLDNFGGSPAMFRLEERNAIGLFGGVTIPLDPQGRVILFAEFNIIDENAVRTGLTFAM